MHRSNRAAPLRPLESVPAPRLGILGGGQLTKVTAAAVATFGCEVVVLERQEDFPAHSVDTHAIIGDWNDPARLLELALLVDVVTLENEFVDTPALEVLPDNRRVLWPSAETIALVQDKLRQKEAFAAAGLPVSRFADAPTPEVVVRFRLPAVLKKRRNSYDGEGNATVRTVDDLPAAWAKLAGDRNALYVEVLCDFTMELAVIVARARDDVVARYPVVASVNREHICHIVTVPAAVPADVDQTMADLAVRAVEATAGVGSFGVEAFLTADGRVLINEIAPRVHNTGHHTIEACACSQFENHVRAVLGWPLGSTAMVAPAAAMVKLLGYSDSPGFPHGLTDALRVPEARVHV